MKKNMIWIIVGVISIIVITSILIINSTNNSDESFTIFKDSEDSPIDISDVIWISGYYDLLRDKVNNKIPINEERYKFILSAAVFELATGYVKYEDGITFKEVYVTLTIQTIEIIELYNTYVTKDMIAAYNKNSATNKYGYAGLSKEDMIYHSVEIMDFLMYCAQNGYKDDVKNIFGYEEYILLDLYIDIYNDKDYYLEKR